MLWLRRLLIWIVAGILVIALRTIWTLEIQTLWRDTVRPYLAANVPSWMDTAIDYLSGFWGGVFATLVVIALFYLLLSVSLLLPSFIKSAFPTAPSLPQQRRESGLTFPGLQKSNRNNYDLIPCGLAVSRTQTPDGIDIAARIRYRNRSKHDLHIKPKKLHFEVDGKPPVGKPSSGVNAVIKPETTDVLRFHPVRIYKENEPAGSATFAVMFGPSRDRVQYALEIAYRFRILSYPQTSRGAADLEIDIVDEKAQYYEPKEG